MDSSDHRAWTLPTEKGSASMFGFRVASKNMISRAKPLPESSTGHGVDLADRSVDSADRPLCKISGLRDISRGLCRASY